MSAIMTDSLLQRVRYLSLLIPIESNLNLVAYFLLYCHKLINQTEDAGSAHSDKGKLACCTKETNSGDNIIHYLQVGGINYEKRGKDG